MKQKKYKNNLCKSCANCIVMKNRFYSALHDKEMIDDKLYCKIRLSDIFDDEDIISCSSYII